MPDVTTRAEFETFVRQNWSTLMSIATTVSASRVEAEDLVQSALTNAYGRWGQVRPDESLAYLRRSILNANVSRWRKHRGLELIVDEPPEQACSDTATQAIDDRDSLMPMLRTLPGRQRAVLVLRYLCDLTDADIATTLGISAGTVRSQAFRGLATLRASHHTRQHETNQHEEVTP